MKKIAFLIIAVIAMMSCSSQPSNNIPYMEYGDAEKVTIPFTFDGILDMIYSPDENFYLVEYMDMAHFNEDEMGDYISISVTKRIFYELLEDLEKSREEQIEIENKEKWIIQSVDFCDYPYEIIKNKKGEEE